MWTSPIDEIHHVPTCQLSRNYPANGKKSGYLSNRVLLKKYKVNTKQVLYLKVRSFPTSCLNCLYFWLVNLFLALASCQRNFFMKKENVPPEEKGHFDRFLSTLGQFELFRLLSVMVR